MTKRRKNGQMSDKELETRRHHASLRKLKRYLSDCKNAELKDYKSAGPYDMCVLSLDDLDLGARKEYLPEDNDSWFVSEDSYETVAEIALYL